jgi:hypothetical protein
MLEEWRCAIFAIANPTCSMENQEQKNAESFKTKCITSNCYVVKIIWKCCQPWAFTQQTRKEYSSTLSITYQY